MTADDRDGDSITSEGMRALEQEIAELEGPARVAMAARIKAARELGDLKENAEYHIAKDDQAHLETRIKQLRSKLARADVVEVDTTADRLSFGRRAEVRDLARDRSRILTLVGAAEADHARGLISVDSPVGRALRDRCAGETVEVEAPAGTRGYRIEKLLD